MNPRILVAVTIAGNSVFTCNADVAHHRIARPQPMLIGYLDAQGQKALPVEEANLQDLTHVVLTNAVRIDKDGNVHLRPSQSPGDLHATEAMRKLTAKPGPALIVSMRGYPDDVALDELAENDEARQNFVSGLAQLVRDWSADGVELEWHADDVSGGKTRNTPFDDQERAHITMLCRDMHDTLQPMGRTLSVAVRPGRKEFDSDIEGLADWLAVRAYSMRSLGDPHHSSLKDADTALTEWLERGVEPRRLVLAVPLFARPGAALRLASRDQSLREPWRALISSDSFQAPPGGDARGDVFLDQSSGSAWWASGFNTTRAKALKVLDGGFGGIAFRDLHHDADGGDSLLQVAAQTVQKYFNDMLSDDSKKVHKVSFLKTGLETGLSLMQSGFRLSATTMSDEM
jgi:hypothetical protein